MPGHYKTSEEAIICFFKGKEKEKGSGTTSVLALGEQNFPTSIWSLDIQKENSWYPIMAYS